MGTAMLLHELHEDIRTADLRGELEDERDGTTKEAELLSRYSTAVRVLRPSAVGGGFKAEGDLRAVSAARNKSNAVKAREIALARAKEQVLHLYKDAPELDLVDFLLKHDKHSDAEAVLTAFTVEQARMVHEGNPALLRTYRTWAALKLATRSFVDAIAYFRKAVMLLSVRRLRSSVER